MTSSVLVLEGYSRQLDMSVLHVCVRMCMLMVYVSGCVCIYAFIVCFIIYLYLSTSTIEFT